MNLVNPDAVHILLGSILNFQCWLELPAIGAGLASPIPIRAFCTTFFFNQVLTMALLSIS